MALFDDMPRSATVRAKTGCTLLVLGKEVFRNLTLENPGILMALARVLSGRIRELNRRIGTAAS
jgi:CRP-like cAMP-binding protein